MLVPRAALQLEGKLKSMLRPMQMQKLVVKRERLGATSSEVLKPKLQPKLQLGLKLEAVLKVNFQGQQK